MYEGDSFLTLSTLGRVGLVLVSLVLFALVAVLLRRLTRGRAATLRLAMAVLAFWAFVWLSPQIYYFFYMLLFEGLPWQSVIKRPPGIVEIASLLTFTDTPNLSNHSKGVMGWVLIGLGLWRR